MYYGGLLVGVRGMESESEMHKENILEQQRDEKKSGMSKIKESKLY